MAKSSAAPAHTPTPWKMTTVKTIVGVCHKIGPLGSSTKIHDACLYDDCYSSEPRDLTLLADAQFIVTACNAHQALYEALSAAIQFNEHKGHCSADEGTHCVCGATKALLAARAALVLADAAQEGEANG